MLRPLYNWTLAKAAHPHAESWLALLAFMDGGLFPFPPHPLLGLMCLANPQKAVRYALITTIASVLGGLLGYTIGHFLYDTIGTQMLGALGLADKFPKAACYLKEYGAEIIVLKGATPIPFLLLTITAGFISFPLGTFLLASLISRAAIFMTVGVLFRWFGPAIKNYIDKYFALVVGAFLVIVVSGYIAVSYFGGGAAKTAEKCDAAHTAIAASA